MKTLISTLFLLASLTAHASQWRTQGESQMDQMFQRLGADADCGAGTCGDTLANVWCMQILSSGKIKCEYDRPERKGKHGRVRMKTADAQLTWAFLLNDLGRYNHTDTYSIIRTQEISCVYSNDPESLTKSRCTATPLKGLFEQ